MIGGRAGDADDTDSQSFMENSLTGSVEEVASPSISSGVPTQGAAEEGLPAHQRAASARRRRLRKDTFFIELIEQAKAAHSL